MSLLWMLAAAAAIAASPTAPADILAPAREGQMQCFRPDTVNKTCGQLVSFAFDAKGGIVETQQIMIIPKPMVVMRAASSVVLRDGALCGTLAKADVESATVTIDGSPAADDITAKIRAQLLDTDRADIGKDSCTSFQPDGDHFAARESIGGSDRPELTVPMIWVKPDDGYKLGGAP